jgi:hypothetical protein
LLVRGTQQMHASRVAERCELQEVADQIGALLGE